MTNRQNVAAVFFDFDDTLIHGDSLLLFLEEMAGWWTARRAFALAAAQALRDRAIGGDAATADFKGAVKAMALRWLLTGATPEDCAAAAQRVAARLRWDRAMLDVVAGHRARGDAVVLATGALDVYLPALLAPLGPLAGVLCTEMAVGADGCLTGAMATDNCVRREKARRVAAWLAEHGPFADDCGYGNRPSDLPMLAGLRRGTVVRLRPAGRTPRLEAYAGG